MSKTTRTIVLRGLLAATLITANTGEGARAEQAREGTMQTTQPNVQGRRLSPDDVRKVAPALEAYTQERLYGEVWKRPGLSARDRSLVTIAALTARDQAPALTYYFNQAIENGVKPREISEMITHLAFYAGWANAFGAVGAARDVFAQRGIGADQIPAASVQLLPLDEAAEADRAKRVGDQFGTVAPGVVQYTTDVLFRDLWRRPDLAPRDRSLVTVSALIATGQAAQLSYHLNRAMDYGLTQPEAAEVLTHLAFYTGGRVSFLPCPSRKTCLTNARVERRRLRRSLMTRSTDELMGIGWAPNELQKIAASDDLHISPLRNGGETYGTPTWIWSVVVDGELYVRAYNGRQSRWYQAALRQRAGRIRAAGMTKEVVFESVDGAINDRIDDAYRAKYGGSPYLVPMIGPRARSATIRVLLVGTPHE